MMKVKDLLPMEIDVDVYDNVCDDIGICFCGPMELTEAGKAEFAEVLEYPCEFHNTGGEYSGIVCIVDVGDAEQDEVWEPRLEKAKAFFEAAAGYCSVDEYSLWFV